MSFLDCLFLVHRNTVEFCVLVLYCAVLLILFISSTGVVMGLWGFSTEGIASSVDKHSLIFSFWIWILLIMCLLALVITSGQILNKSGTNGCPCLIPELWGESIQFLFVCLFSSLNMILPMDFCRCPFSGWGSSPLFLLSWAFSFFFYHQWVLCFYNAFFCEIIIFPLFSWYSVLH